MASKCGACGEKMSMWEGGYIEHCLNVCGKCFEAYREGVRQFILQHRKQQNLDDAKAKWKRRSDGE